MIYAARQFAHMLYPVTKQRGARRELLMIDIAVQRQVHPKNELRHAAKSPPQGVENN
jgi:hypothetical protein